MSRGWRRKPLSLCQARGTEGPPALHAGNRSPERGLLSPGVGAAGRAGPHPGQLSGEPVCLEHTEELGS